MSRDDQDARLHRGRAYTPAAGREAARVGLAALALLLLLTRGPTVADATLHLDVAASIVERGTTALSFDPGALVVTAAPLAGGLVHFGDDGALRSSQPPGMAWVAVPFVAVGVAAARATDAAPLREVIEPVFRDDAPTYRALIRPLVRDPRAIGLAVVGPLAGALALAFVWLALFALGVDRRARALVAAALIASPLGVYAGTCWTQPVTAAALAFAAWRVCLAARGASVSGLAAGAALALAVVVRPDHLPLVLPFALALGAPRRLAGVLAPVAAALVVLALRGVPEQGGGWSPSTLPVGLAGLLVSPLTGLLVYAPVVLAAPLGARAAPRAVRWLLLVPALQLLTYGGWFDWDATLAYGPRFLVPSLPVLALFAGLAARRAPALVGGLAALGALVCAPGHLLAHPRIPESHAFGRPAFVDAWRTLVYDADAAVGAGVDCASSYVPAFAWLALAVATAGVVWELRLTRGAPRPG